MKIPAFAGMTAFVLFFLPLLIQSCFTPLLCYFYFLLFRDEGFSCGLFRFYFGYGSF